MPIHHRSHDAADATIEINPLYARAGETRTVPKLHLPQGELPPDLAYQIVHDELMLDGNARLNLATFVTTWMEPQAQRLMDESVDKNVIDKDEYPQTAELERRCVHMLAGLWHAPGRARRRRLLHHRIERGGDACRACAEMAVAPAPARCRTCRSTSRISSWASTCRCAGRSSAGTGTSSPATCRWKASAVTSRPRPRYRCATRTRSVSSRCSGRRRTAATSPSPRSRPRCSSWQTGGGPDVPAARRRRIRRLHRAVHPARSASGTSGSIASCPSTRRDTSTVSSIRASAG